MCADVKVAKTLNRYFEVIRKTGNLPLDISAKLKVLVFLDSIINDKDFDAMHCEWHIKAIHDLRNCVFSNNCLING